MTSEPLLKTGSKGQAVKDLQSRLNDMLPANRQLVPDGVFGAATAAVIRAFQRLNRLSPDAVVGPKTWLELKFQTGRIFTFHNISLIGQPTTMTCWAASTAMITKSTVHAVRQKTPKSLITASGGLANSSKEDDPMITGKPFADAHNLRCNYPQSYAALGLWGKLLSSPLVFDILWEPHEYLAGQGSPGHMVAVAAMQTNPGFDASNTMLLIYDPLPMHKGKISSVWYDIWMSQHMTGTYRVFERR